MKLSPSLPLDAEAITETISYYQVASYLYKHGLYNALTADEFADYMKQGRAMAAKSRPTQ